VESSSPRAGLLNATRKVPRRSPEPAADSPRVIKRKIERSFELAEEELNNPKRVKHPSKRNVHLVNSTPLLPDLDAFPDSGAFVTIKFATNPVPSSSEYDKRLLTSLFKPIERTEEEEEIYEAALEAHARDPVNVPKPQNFMNYDFFLPHSKTTATNFRRKFDVDDPDREDDGLYTHESDMVGCFQFNRIRAYETSQETELDHQTKYSNEILLATNDDDTFPRQKAVYYYPVLQKSTIRPQRMKNIARTIGGPDEDEKIVERMDVTVQDPNEDMRTAMKKYKEHPFGWEEDEEEPEEVEGEQEQGDNDQTLREQSEDAEGEDDGANGRDRSPAARSRSSEARDEEDDEENED
jgi:RNA polymerase II-associated factor 1